MKDQINKLIAQYESKIEELDEAGAYKLLQIQEERRGECSCEVMTELSAERSEIDSRRQIYYQVTQDLKWL
jgi:hypothetical protein